MVTHERVEATPLRREIGLFSASLASVGVILGAGIYVLIGEAAGEAGSYVWLAFLLAALVAGLTGLSYAELSAMFPKAGAGFEYTRQAFGIEASFVVGWLTLVGEVIAAATVALGFGGYLEALTNLEAGVGAVLLLGGGTIVAAFGVLGSVRIASALTVVEACGLLLVIAIGLLDFDANRLRGDFQGFSVLGAGALVFFAYVGFEQLATLAEEVRDPQRTVPRAIVIAILSATAIYVLVAVVAVGAVGATALAASSAPLAEVARSVLGDRTRDILAGVALAATANTALLLLMAACRLMYGMARAGVLPSLFERLGGGHVPIFGLLLAAGAAMMITLANDIGAVADTTNFAFLLAFGAVNAAVIALRRSRPEQPRPFRTPGRLPLAGLRWIPALPLLGIGAGLALMASLRQEALIVGAGVLATGVVLAFAWRPVHSKSA